MLIGRAMHSSCRTSLRDSNAGFTIIELLIATLVFSVILLLITFGIIQFTNTYYKGITSSNTQNAARNIMDTIAQDIQFSSDVETTAGSGYGTGSLDQFCIGSHRYTYVLGEQVTDDTPDTGINPPQTSHAFLELPNATNADCQAAAQDITAASYTPPPGARELIPPHMRLAKLNITQVGSDLYKITVRVIYGDNDILPHANDPDTKCQSDKGSQFCATSELDTIVQRRVL
jgi:prepilin-type N-terminal cleavage/methylation domain-containing protein